MSVENAGGVRGRVKSLAAEHADELLSLPPRDEEPFTASEFGPKHESILRHFDQTPIIETVRKEHSDRGSWRYHYKINEQARNIAEQQVETRDPMCPCGHSGFENHGEFYTCGFDLCPNTYARAHLEVGR